MFSAYWSGYGYIVYLKDTGGKVNAALAFDTGAVCTVLSIASLTGNTIDKEALCKKLEQRTRRRRFRSASGTDMHGYLVCADNMSLSDYPVQLFFYYLIVDVDDAVALLGNDLISCCDFTHKDGDDIKVSSFNQLRYQNAYSGAVKDADLQALIAEVTLPDT